MKQDPSPLWHPQGKSQNLFLWNAGRLQGVFNHPEYTTDGKWHWLRMADISSNFCTNKLVKLLRLFLESLVPYTSDRTLLLIPVSQFPTTGFLIFFLLIPTLGAFSLLLPAKFHPWNCPLKALSFTSCPYTIDHSVRRPNCISLCLCCILWGPDQEFSSPGSRWCWSTSPALDFLQDTPQSQWDLV